MTAAGTQIQQECYSGARRKGRRGARRGSRAEHRGQRGERPATSDAKAQMKSAWDVKSQGRIFRKLPSGTEFGKAEVAEPTHPAPRRVRFDLESRSEHEITPYAEIYGFHPSEFQFECNDFILLLASDESECDEDEGVDEEEHEEVENVDVEEGWELVHRD